jgi:hypothetical protein
MSSQLTLCCEGLGCRSKKTTHIAEEVIITLAWSD